MLEERDAPTRERLTHSWLAFGLRLQRDTQTAQEASDLERARCSALVPRPPAAFPGERHDPQARADGVYPPLGATRAGAASAFITRSAIVAACALSPAASSPFTVVRQPPSRTSTCVYVKSSK